MTSKYTTCIETPEKIKPFYDKYKDIYHCVYQKDIYSDEQWLEIMPKDFTKASAVQKLKQITQSDEVADECYAMSNAEPELKAAATKIIESNDNDGVARWLAENTLNF